MPEKFVLTYNYPNPFNDSTIIEYNPPSQIDVKIDVFDILGRHMETLLNSNQPAGNHKIAWQAENQSSGIYFYNIQAGEFSDTKRMVLLK